MTATRTIQRDVDRKIGKILKRLQSKGLAATLDYIEQLRAANSPVWNAELTEQLNAIGSILNVLQDRVD